jgi:putative FmdB family regulatory protein
MPLYEYECQKCGKRTEALQRFVDPPLTVCPTCGGDLKKLLSAPAVQFKGTGWYVTDYAGKGSSGKSGSAEGKADRSDSGKSETAAAATETKTKTETKSSGGSSGSSGE